MAGPACPCCGQEMEEVISYRCRNTLATATSITITCGPAATFQAYPVEDADASGTATGPRSFVFHPRGPT